MTVEFSDTGQVSTDIDLDPLYLQTMNYMQQGMWQETAQALAVLERRYPDSTELQQMRSVLNLRLSAEQTWSATVDSDRWSTALKGARRSLGSLFQAGKRALERPSPYDERLAGLDEDANRQAAPALSDGELPLPAPADGGGFAASLMNDILSPMAPPPSSTGNAPPSPPRADFPVLPPASEAPTAPAASDADRFAAAPAGDLESPVLPPVDARVAPSTSDSGPSSPSSLNEADSLTGFPSDDEGLAPSAVSDSGPVMASPKTGPSAPAAPLPDDDEGFVPSPVSDVDRPTDAPWGESDRWLQFPLRDGWRQPAKAEGDASTLLRFPLGDGGAPAPAGTVRRPLVMPKGDVKSGATIPVASTAEMISQSLATEAKHSLTFSLHSPVVRALLVVNLLVYLLLGTIWALAR